MNINGRNVRPNGTRLNSGLDTITTFDLVTSAKQQWAESGSFVFPAPRNSNDFFILPWDGRNIDGAVNYDSGQTIVDGDSYGNAWVPMFACFIAPVDCYIKNVEAYFSGYQPSEDCLQVAYLSIWKKEVTIGGTTTTPITLLTTNIFNIPSTDADYVVQVENSNDSIMIREGQGIIMSMRVSIPAETEICSGYYGSLTIVFESAENQATTGEFMFPSLSVAYNRLDETISNPDTSYRNLGEPAKVIPVSEL